MNFSAGDLETRQGCVDRKFGVENNARDALAANPKAGFAAHARQIPTIALPPRWREKKIVDYLSRFAPTRRAQIHHAKLAKLHLHLRQSSNEKSTAIKARWVTLTESERALELVYPPCDDMKPIVANENAVCLQPGLSPEGHDRPEHLLEGVPVSRIRTRGKF